MSNIFFLLLEQRYGGRAGRWDSWLTPGGEDMENVGKCKTPGKTAETNQAKQDKSSKTMEET